MSNYHHIIIISLRVIIRLIEIMIFDKISINKPQEREEVYEIPDQGVVCEIIWILFEHNLIIKVGGMGCSNERKSLMLFLRIMMKLWT